MEKKSSQWFEANSNAREKTEQNPDVIIDNQWYVQWRKNNWHNLDMGSSELSSFTTQK